MAATREQLTTLFTNLQDLDTQKKDLNDSMKLAFEQFSDENDVNAKALKKAYRNWKDAQKDRETFLIVEAATDELTDIFITLTTA